MRSYSFTVLLTLKFFLCDCQGLFRLAGPQRVFHNSRFEPLYRPFTAKSLLTCYASCLEAPTSCDAISFNRKSFSCDLVPRRDEASVVTEDNWVSVILVQQDTLSDSTSTSTSTTASTTSLTTTATTLSTTTASTTLPTTTAEPTTTPFACPTGFANYNNKCYYMEKTVQKSMTNAHVDCSGRSAELLSIETAGEQEFIRLLIQGAGLSNNFWTSGRGTGSGSYQWTSTLQAVDYTNFADGVPGGNYGTDSCIFMEALSAFKWKLDSCSGGVNRYICEYPKTL